MPPRRRVHGDEGRRRRRQRLQQRVERRPRRPAKRKPEDGVEDDVVGRQGRRRRGADGRVDLGALRDEVREQLFLRLLGVDDVDLCHAEVPQVAGRDEPVAAVVAGPRDDQNGRRVGVGVLDGARDG